MSSAEAGEQAILVPAAGRRRFLQVVLASVFINTSYGTLSYAFSVLVTDGAAGGDLGKGAISLGFGLALLVSGVAAVFTGTVTDLFGSRRLMAAGAAVGAAGLALLSAAQEPWQAVVIMAVVLGPAMAATFYEPVYVLMNRWFTAEERPRAYGLLTVMSGVSITIFIPLTQLLVDAFGWRTATLSLAAILLAVGLGVTALLKDAGPAGAAPKDQRSGPGEFLRETRAGLGKTTNAFWVFSVAFFVATAAFSGVSFHMVAQLEARGFAAAGVAIAVGLTGVVSLPARFFLPSLSSRLPAATIVAVSLAMLAVASLIASAADAWWQVWVYVAVFGAVFGAVYPLRALVVSGRFAGPYFGRVIGLQALLVAVGRAVGPLAVGLAGTTADDYSTSFQVAAALLAASAAVCWLSMRGR